MRRNNNWYFKCPGISSPFPVSEAHPPFGPIVQWSNGQWCNQQYPNVSPPKHKPTQDYPTKLRFTQLLRHDNILQHSKFSCILQHSNSITKHHKYTLKRIRNHGTTSHETTIEQHHTPSSEHVKKYHTHGTIGLTTEQQHAKHEWNKTLHIHVLTPENNYATYWHFT